MPLPPLLSSLGSSRPPPRKETTRNHAFIANRLAKIRSVLKKIRKGKIVRKVGGGRGFARFTRVGGCACKIGRLLRDFLTFLFHSPMPDPSEAFRVAESASGEQRPEKTLVGGEQALIGNFLPNLIPEMPRLLSSSLFESISRYFFPRIFRNSTDTAAFFQDMYIYIYKTSV